MYSNLGTQVGAQNRDFGAVWDGWDSTSVKLCLVEQVRTVANPMFIAFAFTKFSSLDFYLSIEAWTFRQNTSLSSKITYDFQVQV